MEARIRASRSSEVSKACAICGTRLPAEKMIYSRFTGNRYCTDDKKHEKIKAKRKKEKIP